MAEPIYRVVVNHEEQHAIWPADRPAPAGFEAIWTDMRPLSVRG